MASTGTRIQPRLICLEASTVCQLRCRSCPTASGETAKTLGRGFLKADDFKRLIDENPWISAVELSNWGEVFLNRELVSILRLARERKVAVSIHNGANLNDVGGDVLEAVVRYRLRALTCSLDGASQETYGVYRVGGRFRQVIENIETINRFKARYRSPYPRLHWQFVTFGHNEHEIGRARSMAEALGMSFTVKLSWEDLYTEPFSPVQDAQRVRQEMGAEARFREEYERGNCMALWRAPQINYNGRVLGCQVNYWGDYGNAFEHGLLECLNGERMSYARAMLMGLRPDRADIPCTRCPIYRRRKEKVAYLTNDEVDLPGRRREQRLRRFLRDTGHGLLGPELAGRLAVRLRPAIRSGVRLRSRVFPLRVPLPPAEGMQWTPYSLLLGATRSLRLLDCHASVLRSGPPPHPPHAHREEEILLLLSGRVELDLPDGEPGLQLEPGQFVYYPAFFRHTLRTVDAEPASYLMFRWQARPRNAGAALPFGRFSARGPVSACGKPGGRHVEPLFQGPTACLERLHCHRSTLAPGAGYPPHRDRYDTAIVILNGEVETLGQRLGPCGVVFYAAGEPHGMRNPAEVPAQYLVFEFHRRPGLWGAPFLDRAFHQARRSRRFIRRRLGSAKT